MAYEVIDWPTQPREMRDMVLRVVQAVIDKAEAIHADAAGDEARKVVTRASLHAWLCARSYLDASDESERRAQVLKLKCAGLDKALQAQCGEHAANCCAKWCAQCKAGDEALVAIGYKAAF